jgi:hypothetical protein
MSAKSKSLHTLRRLRRLQLDDSRREMARRLRTEDAAAGALSAASGAIAREIEGLQHLSPDVLVSSALSLWSRRGHELVEQAAQTHQRAVADIAPQRTEVAAARAAAEAIEMMAERLRELAARSQARRDQAELDDAAQRSAIKNRYHPINRRFTSGSETGEVAAGTWALEDKALKMKGEDPARGYHRPSRNHLPQRRLAAGDPQ